MIYDNHGRLINYLRLAVTDRCNLRCSYCMPMNGLDWLPRKEVMSFEEMLRACTILSSLGIEKIRITGGEPFVRKDLLRFLDSLVKINGVRQVSITTNGVLTAPYIPQLNDLGIRNVNLSLDTLNHKRFFEITRRDELGSVLKTLESLLHYKMNVKINAVVMENRNIEDIYPLIAMTKNNSLSVRFIEEMPFNGNGHAYSAIKWNHSKILAYIKEAYPGLQKTIDPPFSTSSNYMIPGHQGSVGIIAAYSRSFCGSCNRIRITPQGQLKTCLYGPGVFNIKEAMRDHNTTAMIETELLNAFKKRAANGWEADKLKAGELHPSMAEIGG